MNEFPKVDFYGAYIISIPIHLFLIGWLLVPAKEEKEVFKATF